MKPVYCPTNPHEKAMQRALIQYRDPDNYDLVVEALHKAHREDLIGYGPKCLVKPTRPPRQEKGAPHHHGKGPKGKAGSKRPHEPGRKPQGKSSPHQRSQHR
jgi:hypothetical protein